MQFFAIFLHLVFAIVKAHDYNDDCRFASKYDLDELFTSAEMQEDFLMRVVWWEGKFLKHGIGINFANGLTNFYASMNFESGLSDGPIQPYLDVQSEGLHLSLLALALDGNKYAVNFITSSMQGASNATVVEYVLNQLEKKMTEYEKFNYQYPGFGGYLQWAISNSSGITPIQIWIESYKINEFVWSLAAIVEVLNASGINVVLETRYSNYLRMLAQNAITIFFKNYPPGNLPGFLYRVNIDDICTPPNANSYGLWDEPNCNASNPCFLNSQWDAEYAWFFLYLHANWAEIDDGETKKNLTRTIKMNNFLRAVEFQSDSGAITVLESGQNQIEERFGFLFLPYFDVDLAKRVFLNGERARVRYSNMNNIPGLSFNPHLPAQCPPIGDAYIGPEVTVPLFLHPSSQAYGTVWLAFMLQLPKMQGPLGHTWRANFSGVVYQEWLQFVKLHLVLGICGGISDITRRYLQRTDMYEEFLQIVEASYNTVFSNDLKGENISFVLPDAKISTVGVPFTHCSGLGVLSTALATTAAIHVVLNATEQPSDMTEREGTSTSDLSPLTTLRTSLTSEITSTSQDQGTSSIILWPTLSETVFTSLITTTSFAVLESTTTRNNAMTHVYMSSNIFWFIITFFVWLL